MKSISRSFLAFHLVRRRCPPHAEGWVQGVLTLLEAPLERQIFDAAYAGARRRLGDAPAAWEVSDAEAMGRAGLLSLDGRGLDEVFRVALLLHATEVLPAAEHLHLIDEVFRRSDNHERQALLRALELMPDPQRFLATAVEACRSNVQTVFEAIACDNGYPCRYFPEQNFNQMVLKALFIGAPLGRVTGLGDRIAPDLIRMVADYARERRAAGRPVPRDAALIVGPQGVGSEAV